MNVIIWITGLRLFLIALVVIAVGTVIVHLVLREMVSDFSGYETR